MSFKSGFVSIIGKPNVGKSTLLNKFTNEKIAITSNKPQTTRNTIKSVVTDEEYQIIFLDTPGIHKPRNQLGKYMVEKAEETIKEVDVILFVVEVKNTKPTKIENNIIEILNRIKLPVILVINKIDTLSNMEDILPIINLYSELYDFTDIVPVSVINDKGVDLLLDKVKANLREGPKFFPDDTLTDQPERQIMAEIIREKMLMLLSDEIPYGVGIEIISFKESEEKKLISIQANIYCEKTTHKGIIIGKKGSMLKEIGTKAREDMEKLLGIKIYLELWVKIKVDWRNDSNMLKTLGYK